MNRPGSSKRKCQRFLDLKTEDIEFMRLLGSGNSGNMWLACVHDREMGTRSVYAAKKVKHQNSVWADGTERGSRELEALKNEFDIYLRLQCHPNFPKLIGVVHDEKNFTIVTEYVDGGDLLSFLRSKAGDRMFISQPVGDVDYNECTTFKRKESQVKWAQKFNQPQKTGTVTTSILVYIALQIAHALKCLVVDLNVLHRDTAARNVLVTGDFTVKLTDFGLARFSNYDQESRMDLPFAALAIETLRTHKCTAQSEVWQFGVLLFEIFSLGMLRPYGELLTKNNTTQRPAIKLQRFLERGGRLSPPSEMPEPIKRLMAKCFQENPEDRPTFQNIIKVLHELLEFMSPELAEKMNSTAQQSGDKLRDDGRSSVNFAFSPGEPAVEFTNSKRPNDLRPLLQSDEAGYEEQDGVRFLASMVSPRQNSTDIFLPEVASSSPSISIHTYSKSKFCLSKVSKQRPVIRVVLLTALVLFFVCIACLALYQLFSIKETSPSSIPSDCLDLLTSDRNLTSGVYEIYSKGAAENISVYCDMATDGGGWTVFQRRTSNSSHVFFNQPWQQYKNGFGMDEKMDNFWLGLDRIHELSNKDASVELRIEFFGPLCQIKAPDPSTIHCIDANQEWFGVWKRFSIENETSKYKLHVSEPGNGSLNSNSSENDGLIKTNDNQSFTTYDSDNDKMSKINCARLRQQGAWWYKDCACSTSSMCTAEVSGRGTLDIALNGKYHEKFDYEKDTPHGIIWEWQGTDPTLGDVHRVVPIRTEMKLRRAK